MFSRIKLIEDGRAMVVTFGTPVDIFQILSMFALQGKFPVIDFPSMAPNVVV